MAQGVVKTSGPGGEISLRDVYLKLYAHFGPQNWWPSDGRFEMIIGAILTQSTAWANVEKAIASLKQANVLCPRGLRSIPQARLAGLGYPSGYFNVKARQITAEEAIRLATNPEALTMSMRGFTTRDMAKGLVR